ncbi:MAG TPA: hypothetical protein VIW68_10020 [Candidatus Sulfotelmatobacter sp.]
MKDSVNRYAIILIALISVMAVAFWKVTRRPALFLRAAVVPLRPVSPRHIDPVQQFSESFPLQVAVLWTNTNDGTTSPLALVHALKEMGIPFFVTRDFGLALRHDLVILYPGVDSRTFQDAQARQLTEFVRKGGSIFAQNVFSGGLRPLFGFRDYSASRKRYRVAFASTPDPITKYLNRPEERETRLGSERYSEIIWSNGYAPNAGAQVLARFDDGSAALLENSVGKGRVYLLGLSLADVILRSQNNRDYEAERHYVNWFEPGADVWMLVLRAWYESHARKWVRLATIPNGQRSAVLLSHDVDWENSFAPGLDFARIEKENHASSTFFIQTKYVDDANSKAFFFEPQIEILRRLESQGSSVGSHSIIHSRGFDKFDLGSGHETYASYNPRGLGFDTASGATVFGEVRVSKELLDGEILGQQTIFFRAGHLRVPRSLGEALARSGYQFDSSFTADDVLSNFPYALPRDPGFDEDSEIYEFPVTIEDEEPPGFAQRVPQALAVIRANAENGAVSVVLVHSNESRLKAAAEDTMLQQLPADILQTDMLSFAKFWRARDRLQWSVHATSIPKQVVLQVTADESVTGLTFEFEQPVATITGLGLLGIATVSADHHHVILPELKAAQSASFRVSYLQ